MLHMNLHTMYMWSSVTFSVLTLSRGAPAERLLRGEGFGPPSVGGWHKARGKALVQHVLEKVTPGDAKTAAKEFDAFSDSRRMGMHLGKEKGAVIEHAMHRAVRARTDSATGPISVLELGAHLGDGTLRIVGPLLDAGGEGHLVFSVEDDPDWASGCRAVVAHVLGKEASGLRVRHESVVMDPEALPRLVQAIREHHGVAHFDVVVLDHEHARYLTDLRALVNAGVLRPGGLVVADNAGRDSETLADYLDFVQTPPFRTELHAVSRPYPDKVAVSELLGGQEL